MENRYSNTNQTAPVLSAMKNKKLPVPHSFFDLTRNVAFDCGLGWLVPFDLIETLPDSDYEISYDILAMTRNPLVRRLLNGCTIYVHTYGIACSDLWEGFPTFVSRGRSGKITRTVPTIQTRDNDWSTHEYSPSSYLGVPPRNHFPDSVSSDTIINLVEEDDRFPENLNPVITFNALPLVFYQQVCVYNYLPSNLLQSNKEFYPDDEMHFRLSSTVTGHVNYLSYDDDIANQDVESVDTTDNTLSRTTTKVLLNALRVRQFQGDRFNTGLPFPELVRGDIPQIDLASGNSLTIPALSLTSDGVAYTGKDHRLVFERSSTPYEFDNVIATSSSGDLSLAVRDDIVDGQGRLFVATPDKTAPTSVPISIQSSITVSQLNALQVLTLMRQRAALSDGSYNELIRAQYNESPDLHVGKPFYIGGTKQPLIFNEVVQTSASESGKPLGSTGSRAVSAGNGYIGKYHSKDFGYIMSVLSVVPDVYYTQGLERLWSRVNQSQFHFPLMDNLAPDAILNKELYVSGNSAVDDDVFAYQERDSEYKSRPNVLRGGLAVNKSGVNEDLKAYSMKRTFSATPSLSYGMTGMFPSNMDYSVFSNSVDTPFIFSITSRVKATLPLPYVTMPNDGLTRIA